MCSLTLLYSNSSHSILLFKRDPSSSGDEEKAKEQMAKNEDDSGVVQVSF